MFGSKFTFVGCIVENVTFGRLFGGIGQKKNIYAKIIICKNVEQKIPVENVLSKVSDKSKK